MKRLRVVVGPDDAGMRLDRFIRQRFPLVPVQKLIRTKDISGPNKERLKPDRRLEEGEIILARVPDESEPLPVVPEHAEPPLPILFEDEHMRVLDKPAGMAMHVGTGLEQATCVSDCLRPDEITLHRLDRHTSGCLLVARNRPVARLLSGFGWEVVEKQYAALTCGVPSPASGLVDAPVGRKSLNRNFDRVQSGTGKAAVTRYSVVKVVNSDANVALVHLWPQGGRRHQLRAHLADILHCPILGDVRFGGRPYSDGILLHALRIKFPHPIIEGAFIDVTSPLPKRFARNFH